MLVCRQHLVSLGTDGELKIWAIKLDQEYLSATGEKQRPVALQLLVHVGVSHSALVIPRLHEQAGSTSCYCVSWTSQLDVCSTFGRCLLDVFSMFA